MRSKEDTHPNSRFSDMRILGEKTECLCLKFVVNHHNSLMKSAGKYPRLGTRYGTLISDPPVVNN